MTARNFIWKGIFVLFLLLIIGWLGQYIFYVDGKVDLFRLLMVYGIPIGIPYMVVWIPLHRDVGGSMAMIVFCIVIGGLFGSVIAAGLGIRALYYLVGYPINRLLFRR